MYNKKPVIIQAAELRDSVGDISAPAPGATFLVTKRGAARVLLVPTQIIYSIADKQRLFLGVATAMHKAGITCVVSDDIGMVSQTELRRSATAFYQRVAMERSPGFVTSYDQIVGVYVPVTSQEMAERFLAEYNHQLWGKDEEKAD